MAPHKLGRWMSTGVMMIIYAIRVYTISGWYIVTYALGIYYLNREALAASLCMCFHPDLLPGWKPSCTVAFCLSVMYLHCGLGVFPDPPSLHVSCCVLVTHQSLHVSCCVLVTYWRCTYECVVGAFTSNRHLCEPFCTIATLASSIRKNASHVLLSISCLCVCFSVFFPSW